MHSRNDSAIVTPDPPFVGVGELIRRGLVLRTSEAVALVHGVCMQSTGARAGGAGFPTVDDLRITRAGDLSIDRTRPSLVTDPRTGAAALLDALLPPSGGRSDDDVPDSLRTLPARLRASVDYAPRADPRDLLAILQRHLTDDPRLVLQQTGRACGSP